MTLPLIGLAVVLRERRLGVERIDLARRAVHEQEDAVLGLRGVSGACGESRSAVSLRPRWKRRTRRGRADRRAPATRSRRRLARGTRAASGRREWDWRRSSRGADSGRRMAVSWDRRTRSGSGSRGRAARAPAGGQWRPLRGSRNCCMATRFVGGRLAAEGQAEGEVDLPGGIVAGFARQSRRRSAPPGG